jgi:prepilin-type N-terminal cleavage/methylation domain-containing protein
MNTRGFTLVEMIVCVAIFAMMTALVVAKYGNFNQSVLLTDLAYDTAITIRTAQTYGLGAQSSQMGNNPFKYAYGVDFSTAAGSNDKITMFIDNYPVDNYPVSAPNGVYDSGFDSLVSTYTVTRGAVVSAICVSNSDGNDCLSSGVPVGNANQLDITFQRPNPDAVICANGSCGTKYPFAAIFIKGTDGSTREVIVRDTGQISVQE